MAEKKWSNYWGKYRSEDESKPKSQKGERPTVTISPKIPRISRPKIASNLNIPSVFMIILALGVLGLGFWQFKSAKTIDVLKQEGVDLECQLGNCTEQLQNVNVSLSTCASNLGTCNSDLSKKISALNTCENEKTGMDKDYKNCKDDLLQYKRDYEDVKDSFDDCENALDKKGDDLSSCNSNYDSLKSNYLSLCNSHCSTSCTFSDNQYTCVTTTTTTTSTTTTTHA